MPFVERSPFRTYYHAEGEGPPLIFIHGAWLDHRMWRKQQAYFAGWFRTVAYDMEGHGRSLDPPPHRYSVGRWADELSALVDALFPGRRVHLCGLSLGGVVAAYWAHHHPDRTASLIIAASPIDFGVPRWLRPIMPPFRAALTGILHLLPFRWIVRAASGGLRRILGRTRQRRGTFMEYVEECFQTMGKRRWTAVLRAALRYEGLPEYHLPSATLLIEGAHDHWFIRRRMQRLARRIHRPLRTLPHAAHMVNIEQPAEFHRIVHQFLLSNTTT